MQVQRFAIPGPGIDTVDITIEEDYDVEGVGSDRVTLRGVLIADRGAPLLGSGRENVEWETSTVVAQFTSLEAEGTSGVFGSVHVSLDNRVPSFGVVRAGDCKAALSVEVSMPEHNLVLRSAEPVQLKSQVETIPPVGDELTESVRPVALLDDARRERGVMQQVHVTWRDLTDQVEHEL